MDLLREWRRRTYGAAAGAVIAPVAITAAALAVGFGGGGIGGLGSLSQAFEGPDLPSVAPLSQTRSADDAGRLLARVRRSAGPAAATSPGSGEAAPTATDPVATAVPTTPPDDNGDGDPNGTFDPGDGTVPVPTPAPTTAPPAQTPAPPPPEPTSVIDSLPVVGEPAGQVVDDLTEAVDGLLP